MPTICIKQWALNATMFDGDEAAGLVPTLFAVNTEAAEDAINKDPQKAHWDTAKINKIFFIAESVNLREAMTLLKKPR